MTAPVSDYLKLSLAAEAGPALTAHSSPSDTAGVVEILRLVTDPKVHERHLNERRQIAAERADLARGWRELRRAKQAQQEELAEIRAAFDAAMATDKANQQAENARAKAALFAEVEEWQRLLARFDAAAAGRQGR